MSMSLFHPLPESTPRPSCHPELDSGSLRKEEDPGSLSGMTASFSEAILASSSSVRDSLPEQYRAHFETLRQEIIDFAKAHGIPRDALTKSDVLREAASKLSTPDLTQLATLLERFEYLLVHHEPKKEEFPEHLQEIERLYNLEKQYDSQVSLLEQVGILKEGAIEGIDGNKYPIPTLEQIAKRLYERKEELSTKHDQGFTKLLLVPFGMSLDSLFPIFEQFLLTYKQTHPKYKQNTVPFSALAQYTGSDAEITPYLVYNPRSFHQTKHQGQTKRQILREQQGNPDFFPGWTVHLFQPSDPTDTNSKGFVSLRRKGEGRMYGDIVRRFDIETGKTSEECLQIFEANGQNPDTSYHQESGLTPEDWIMTFMTHLIETGETLDYSDGKNMKTLLVRAFFRWSAHVPSVYWSHVHQDISFNTCGPRFYDDNTGIRSSVVV